MTGAPGRELVLHEKAGGSEGNAYIDTFFPVEPIRLGGGTAHGVTSEEVTPYGEIHVPTIGANVFTLNVTLLANAMTRLSGSAGSTRQYQVDLTPSYERPATAQTGTLVLMDLPSTCGSPSSLVCWNGVGTFTVIVGYKSGLCSTESPPFPVSSPARQVLGEHRLIPQVPGRRESFSTAVIRLRLESIAAIQSTFGFSTQVLAQVLRISRPNLYKWLDSRETIDMHAKNRKRLALMESLANKWNALARAPLSLIASEPILGGKSALELLTGPTVDKDTVLHAFELLAKRLEGRTKSRSERRVEEGFKRRPSRRALASDD